MFNLNTSKFLKYILFILISYLFLGFVNIDVRAEEIVEDITYTDLNLILCGARIDGHDDIVGHDYFEFVCYQSGPKFYPVYAFEISDNGCDPIKSDVVCKNGSTCESNLIAISNVRSRGIIYKNIPFFSGVKRNYFNHDDFTCNSLSDDMTICADGYIVDEDEDEYGLEISIYENCEDNTIFKVSNNLDSTIKYVDYLKNFYTGSTDFTCANFNFNDFYYLDDSQQEKVNAFLNYRKSKVTLNNNLNIPKCILDQTRACSSTNSYKRESDREINYNENEFAIKPKDDDIQMCFYGNQKSEDDCNKGLFDLGGSLQAVCISNTPCSPGDVCAPNPQRRDWNHCMPSDSTLNISSGYTCIAGEGKGITPNTSPKNRCGVNVPFSVSDVPVEGGYYICDKSQSEVCVNKDGTERGNLDSTNMPDQGFCLKCVQHDDSALIGKSCNTEEEIDARGLYSDEPFKDPCCHPDFKCISGKCQEKTYTVCGGDKKRADELNSDNNLFIAPGEICKYEGDEDSKDFCKKKRCSTSEGLNDESGNTRCRAIIDDFLQPNPGFFRESQPCQNSCGCPGDLNCNNGFCKICKDTNESCSNTAECCNNNAFECRDNLGTPSRPPIPGKSCQPKCPDDSGSCYYNGTNTYLSNICCGGKFCNTDNKCIEHENCIGKGAGECCGYSRMCDEAGDCVEASDDNTCSSFYIEPIPGAPTPDKTIPLKDLLTGIVAILYPLAIILGMGYLIFGGYKLISSQGSPEEVKSAQEMLTSAIIGMIFIILSATILRFVLNFILNVQI